jgi:hypothetical protein
MLKYFFKLVGINPLTRRVNSAKTIFKKAHKEALKAQTEIEKEHRALSKKKSALERKMDYCDTLHNDNNVFITNISKFI